MFESLRESINDLLSAARTPEDRRSALAAMKQSIVHARMGLDDLREGIEVTRRKVTAEQQELDVVRRRKSLAEGIRDAETVAIAVRFEQQHAGRLEVLQMKLQAQEAELAMVEREVVEMTAQLKAAASGVGTGLGGAGGDGSLGSRREAALDDELGLDQGSGLRDEIDSLSSSRRRSARETAADERLAELKKRMGK